MRRAGAKTARVFLLVLAFHSVAWAEGKEEVVVTGTRTPEASQRSVVRVDVVGKGEMERRGALSVADALASQPGVRIGAGDYGYLGEISALQIQGFDRDRVLILEDGERVIGDTGGAIDLASLPTSDLERIEIVTGPQSALYGASAIGGVVNLISGPPAQLGFSGRGRLEVRSRGGALFQGWGGMRNDDGSWLRADLSATKQEGVLLGAGPALLIPSEQRTMAGLRVGVPVSERWFLRGRVRWLRGSTQGRETKEIPGLGTFRLDLPEQSDRYTTQIIAERSFQKGTGLRISGAHQTYLQQSEQGYPESPAKELRHREYGLSSIEPTITIADKTRTWVFGGRLEAEHFSQELEKISPGISGISREFSQEVPNAQRTSGALYGQLVWKCNSRWSFLPGLRHELHSRYGQATAPRFAVAWRPRTGVIVRAGAGRGYRAPSAKELGFVFDHSAYGYRVQGNDTLHPESSWGATLDMTMRSEPITLRLGGFANRIEQMIDLDMEAPQISTDGVATYTYRNRGQARTAGGTVALQTKIDAKFRSEISYDYLWTRDDTTRTPIAGRPAHALTVGLLAEPTERLGFHARWRIFSESYAGEGPRSPGYSSLDLRLSYELWSGSQLYLGGINLLDAKRTAGRPGDLRPALGRTVYLGFRLDFPSEDS